MQTVEPELINVDKSLGSKTNIGFIMMVFLGTEQFQDIQ